jgi:hypothetical protein
MVMNAVLKLVYSIFRQKYGVVEKKAPAKVKKAPVKKAKKASDSEDSEFSVKSFEFQSDDSDFAQQTATMQQICESLDSVQIVSVCLSLIEKKNINENEAVFKCQQELTVTFFERLLSIANLFKNKAKVIKEAYIPLL